MGWVAAARTSGWARAGTVAVVRGTTHRPDRDVVVVDERLGQAVRRDAGRTAVPVDGEASEAATATTPSSASGFLLDGLAGEVG